MKIYELGDLDEILRTTADKGTILVARDGKLVGDYNAGLDYLRHHPNVAYHLGCTPLVSLGSYTLCGRVGAVLLTKQVRDALMKRPGTLEMRLALTPQVLSPEILFKTDWPFQGAQVLAYFFARLIPFVFVVFCIVVFVFREKLVELGRSFLNR